MSNLHTFNVTATYDHFGTANSRDFVIECLAKGVSDKLIDSFTVFDVREGRLGLNHVDFTFKVSLDDVGTIGSLFDDARELANLIVGDTDVHINRVDAV